MNFTHIACITLAIIVAGLLLTGAAFIVRCATQPTLMEEGNTDDSVLDSKFVVTNTKAGDWG